MNRFLSSAGSIWPPTLKIFAKILWKAWYLMVELFFFGPLERALSYYRGHIAHKHNRSSF